MLSLISGLLLGLALIVAIGAQNAFVLRQGLLDRHVTAVVVVCAGSDILLIGAGVAGLGRLLDAAPWVVGGARWAGALFLLGYGLLAAWRAVVGVPDGLDVGREPAARADDGADAGVDVAVRTRSAAPAVGTALALTWLNPHVYLDTVVLLGSVAATHGDSRWLFATGACLASIGWFCALGWGARRLGHRLHGPRVWRVLDAAIAVTMLVVAVVLVTG